MEPTKWQRAWVAKSFAPGVRVSALSVTRANGKTALCGHLCAEALTPGTSSFDHRTEVVIVASSMEQVRTMFGFVQDELDDRGVLDDYRFVDSNQRLGVLHKPSGAKLRAISSDPKRAMGLSRFKTIIGDEPASWPDRAGTLMYHALRQSIGKRPGQRLLLVGTRSPAMPGSWWPALLDHGGGDGVVVTSIGAPQDAPWDAWSTIRKANPLFNYSPSLRAVLKAERDEARRNPALRPAFEAFRLNRLVDVRQHVLLQLHQWQDVKRREAPPRVGRCVVGVDLGASRSWSAAWAQWPNGRAEVIVLAPGVPDLATVSRQDAMPAHLYETLVEAGVLHVDEGLQVARPERLMELIVEAGWDVQGMIADRFLGPKLYDAVAGRWPLVTRQTRWSEQTEDISAFRKSALDGALAIEPRSKRMVELGLSHSEIESDTSGNVRMIKTHGERSRRDDVIMAGLMAAGAVSRMPPERPYRVVLVGQ